MADFTQLITAIPDALKSIFGLIDKAVPDRDKAYQMKFDLFAMIQGQTAKYWLPSNAFSMVMLCNYGMIAYLTVMGMDVPEWALWLAGAWLLGPLLNTLSKETIGKLGELIKGWVEWQTKRKEMK